ncbi:monovalent cation/H(+) antiporter subunit G [Chthonobacter albigriseus]|uniref:monovalent cation/H(+) antiporter subunit G n=1 Tax=Chthonobacter albigriseus TaxID=1683161 RepID=UPI0015EF86F2|nr:monovalent cation/H(+) antiporter subunit G [Chthonobacter albigriseus]
MSSILAVLTGILLLVGAGFALIGALGVLRFPDVYTRMHAASKAGTLGSGFCLLAVAVNETSFDVTTRALAGVIFFLLTAPVSAHLLARAAVLAGYVPLGTGKNPVLSSVQRKVASPRSAKDSARP